MIPQHPRRDLLLAAADWQSRTLILAELQEAGYEVMAVPGLGYAVKALATRQVEPPLILLDVHDDELGTPKRVEGLLELAPGVALILVVGAYNSAAWEPLRARVAALLRRPIAIGQIVDIVRRTMPLP